MFYYLLIACTHVSGWPACMTQKLETEKLCQYTAAKIRELGDQVADPTNHYRHVCVRVTTRTQTTVKK
jgi:hypothetical protein